MLSFQLDWQLDEITSPGSLRDVAFDLLRYAEAQGKIDDLLQAASTANPGNLQLKDARAALLTGTVSQAQSPDKPGSQAQDAAIPQKAAPLKLIYCYASKDTRYAVELEKHLSGLAKGGHIEPPWNEARIAPGAVRGDEIKRRWQAADIIVTLVSTDLLADDKNDYLARAAERMRAGAAVVPVIIRPSLWQDSWIGQEGSGLQVLPRDEGEVKPISRWTDEGDAWVQVVEGLKTVIAARRGR